MVIAHPAIDREQGYRQAPWIQADGDHMGEGTMASGSTKQVQMAMLAIVAMAVVIALGAAAWIHKVARGVVALLEWNGPSGKGLHE